MPFTPNPFDMSGTLDTSGYGLTGSVAFKGNAGTTYGSTAPSAYGGTAGPETTAETSVRAVCPAFSDSSLQAHAAARLQPDQRLAERTY